MKRKYSKELTSSNESRKRTKLTPANLIQKTMEEDFPGYRYIDSKYDQLNKVRIGTVNVLNSAGVKGLFATDDIPKDTIIGRYSGNIFYDDNKTVLDVETGEMVDVFDYHYTVSFEVKGKAIHIDGSKAGGCMIYINHARDRYNCIYALLHNENEPVLVVYTTKPVKKGEQLLAIYTPNYQCDGMVFLNPDDNDQSAGEYFKQHEKAYSFVNLYDDDDAVFLVPKIYEQLSQNVKYNKSELNLYILPYNTNKNRPYEFSEQDRISLLMQACKEGNDSVVQKLVKGGVDVNQQQNQSGNSALNFAIEGYRTSINKDSYTDIMIYLIESGADLEMKNAKNLTFLDQAIRYLLTPSFERILSVIRETDWIDYLQDNKEDFIKYGLLYEKLDNVKLALDYCTVYTFFADPGDPEKQINIRPQELADIVQNYPLRKFKLLCSMLEQKKCHGPGIEKLKYLFNHSQKEKLSQKTVNNSELNPNYIDLTLWGKKKSSEVEQITPDVELKRK